MVRDSCVCWSVLALTRNTRNSRVKCGATLADFWSATGEKLFSIAFVVIFATHLLQHPCWWWFLDDRRRRHALDPKPPRPAFARWESRSSWTFFLAASLRLAHFSAADLSNSDYCWCCCCRRFRLCGAERRSSLHYYSRAPRTTSVDGLSRCCKATFLWALAAEPGVNFAVSLLLSPWRCSTFSWVECGNY